jgi:hypothetical protein
MVLIELGLCTLHQHPLVIYHEVIPFYCHLLAC